MFLVNSLCFKDKTIIEEIFEQTQLLKLEKKFTTSCLAKGFSVVES